MATLAAPHPSLLGEDAREDRPPETPGGEGRSLDDLISEIWRSLGARPTACPVCGGELAPRYGAGARPVGARCKDCGSELS